MNIKEISELIIIKNYAETASNNSNAFSNADYKKISDKIGELTSLINKEILSLDLSDFKKESVKKADPVKSTSAKVSSYKINDESEYKYVVFDPNNESVEESQPVSDPVPVDKDILKSKPVKKAARKPSPTTPVIETSDEDDKLVADMLAVEKAKLKGSKKK